MFANTKPYSGLAVNNLQRAREFYSDPLRWRCSATAPEPAPARVGARAYTHGQGAAYIALVTASSVVSLDGPASVAGWAVPMLVGLPLIERRIARINHEEAMPLIADTQPGSQAVPTRRRTT